MYQTSIEKIKILFNTSAFTIDGLKDLENHSSRLWAKFRHIENVANLMLKAAEFENFSEKEKAMAFASGQFHDIACINDIALTGKEYGPKHGARSATIAYGIFSRNLTFTSEEAEIIARAIENHDTKEIDKELTGFARKLASLLRDCDKIDCYRRQANEPLENIFQRPIDFKSGIREDFANQCLSGIAIKYNEMQTWNEEALLYLGWFFQINNDSCRKLAFGYFENLVARIKNLTKNQLVKHYCDVFLQKALCQIHH